MHDIEFLKNHYKTETQAELGIFLGRTRAAVSEKLIKLGLAESYDHFTPAEQDFIRKAYPVMQTCCIAKVLDRTSKSVRHWANRTWSN